MSFIYMLNLPPPNEDVLKVGKTVDVKSRMHQLSTDLINVQGDYTLYFSVEVVNNVSRVETKLLDYLKSRYKLFNPRKSCETFIYTDSDAMKAEAKKQLLLLVEDDRSTLFPDMDTSNNGSGVNDKKRKSVLKWLLDNEKKLWSNGHIAKECSVSTAFVTKISLLISNSNQDYTRPTRLKYINKCGNITWIETSNIGNR